MQFDNSASVSFPAKSINESFSRLFVAGFFSQLDPTIAEITDIKTAVSEAVTNAIIHGYEDKEGIIDMYCGYKGKIAYIEIKDEGKGIENITLAREPLYTSKPEMERSGMGFTIMETFMDSIQIKTELGKGTKICMIKKLLEG